MERLLHGDPELRFNLIDGHLEITRINKMQRGSHQQQNMFNIIDTSHSILLNYRENLLESRICPLTMKCSL
jgi:hypothetical protein